MKEERMSVSGKRKLCPACGGNKLQVFFEVEGAPANSVVCIPNREQALDFPRGIIQLTWCGDCGFVFNACFDESLTQYAGDYESTQSFSHTFNRFHVRLAEHLIERFSLRGKKILEIGCGQGEFLHLLAEMGGNVCVGFDPAYRGNQWEQTQAINLKKGSIRVVKDYFSERHGRIQTDFVCCKMTLEHIPDVYDFLLSVKKPLEGSGASVFFQIPDFGLILRQGAFQDVYYEHCSYFTRYSLFRLFDRAGFGVLNIWTGFDDQYLMIEADLSGRHRVSGDTVRMEEMPTLTKKFTRSCQQQVDQWNTRFAALGKEGRSAVVWSSSSKAVAFLTAIKGASMVEYVVDINPRRQGFFMAGTGQEIVSPESLRSYRPDAAAIMNPVYLQEIKGMLKELGIYDREQSSGHKAAGIELFTLG